MDVNISSVVEKEKGGFGRINSYSRVTRTLSTKERGGPVRLGLQRLC